MGGKLGAVFIAFAGLDGAFRYPKSESGSMEEIAQTVDPMMKVADAGEIDGKPGIRSFVIMSRDSRSTIVQYDPQAKEVWINAAALQEGQSRGGAVYSIVGNWAHNNAYVFIGDPAGVSNAAIYRRTENMILLALKFGTTDFISPHEDQLYRVEKSRAGEPFFWPGFEWRTGDAAFNLDQMLNASYNAIEHHAPWIKDFHYEPATDAFRNLRSGQGYSRADFGRLSQSAGARNAHSGVTTLERAIIAGSVLRANHEPQRGREFLAGVEAGSGIAAHRLNELFGSKQDNPMPFSVGRF